MGAVMSTSAPMHVPHMLTPLGKIGVPHRQHLLRGAPGRIRAQPGSPSRPVHAHCSGCVRVGGLHHARDSGSLELFSRTSQSRSIHGRPRGIPPPLGGARGTGTGHRPRRWPDCGPGGITRGPFAREKRRDCGARSGPSGAPAWRHSAQPTCFTIRLRIRRRWPARNAVRCAEAGAGAAHVAARRHPHAEGRPRVPFRLNRRLIARYVAVAVQRSRTARRTSTLSPGPWRPPPDAWTWRKSTRTSACRRPSSIKDACRQRPSTTRSAWGRTSRSRRSDARPCRVAPNTRIPTPAAARALW